MSEKLTPDSILKERTSHPLGGPFIWAFSVINWEVVVWVAGSVTNPEKAYIGIQSWLFKSSILNLVVYPLVWTTLYVLLGPVAVRYYLKYLDANSRKRHEDKLTSDKKGAVPAATYDFALNTVRWQQNMLNVLKEQQQARLVDLNAIYGLADQLMVSSKIDLNLFTMIQTLRKRAEENFLADGAGPFTDPLPHLESLRPTLGEP